MSCIKIVVQHQKLAFSAKHQSVTVSLTITKGDNLISTPTFDTPEKRLSTIPHEMGGYEGRRPQAEGRDRGSHVRVIRSRDWAQEQSDNLWQWRISKPNSNRTVRDWSDIAHRPFPTRTVISTVVGSEPSSPPTLGSDYQWSYVSYPLLRYLELKCGRKEELETKQGRERPSRMVWQVTRSHQRPQISCISGKCKRKHQTPILRGYFVINLSATTDCDCMIAKPSPIWWALVTTF